MKGLCRFLVSLGIPLFMLSACHDNQLAAHTNANNAKKQIKSTKDDDCLDFKPKSSKLNTTHNVKIESCPVNINEELGQ